MSHLRGFFLSWYVCGRIVFIFSLFCLHYSPCSVNKQIPSLRPLRVHTEAVSIRPSSFPTSSEGTYGSSVNTTLPFPCVL